jgi:hypothetical protein
MATTPRGYVELVEAQCRPFQPYATSNPSAYSSTYMATTQRDVLELPEAPPEIKLPLVSPGSSDGRLELVASRRSEDSQTISITVRDTLAELPSRTDNLDLALHPVVPLYSISQDRGSSWDMLVDYKTLSQTYRFRSREDVCKFQQFLTRQQPLHHFENVRVSVSFSRTGRLRNERYLGQGELQLWVPAAELQQSGSRVLSLVPSVSNLSLQSSHRAPSMTTIAVHGAVTVQTNPQTGTRVRVFSRLQGPQPPLLVALLRDDPKSGGGYTMLKARGKQ